MPIDPQRIKRFALVALIILLAALFIGGHQPTAGSLFTPPWDKVAHILFYGTIAALFSLAIPSLSLPSILLVSLAVGAADEIHQIFVPGRHAGLDDLAADFVGITLTLLLIPRLRRHLLDPG
jgi:VanZ family protein